MNIIEAAKAVIAGGRIRRPEFSRTLAFGSNHPDDPVRYYVQGGTARTAHAKKTLHQRKFPKREQKIIVAYKGKLSGLKDRFAPIGRL